MAIQVDTEIRTMRKLGFSDTFAFSRILKKMEIKDEVTSFFRKGMEVSQKAQALIDKHGADNIPEDQEKEVVTEQISLGTEFFYTVLVNLGEAETEFYKWLGDLYGVNPGEVKQYADLQNVIEDIKENEGLPGFLNGLKAVMKLMR
ncbi:MULTISPECIES: hypothetical protein [Bacillus cereus group]|uniref:Uncharacterized protein n=1 Tax=Bacillus cytotoxicus (strain DSM 22905 / CIP 110041 / 391-98 / NVH 391-98) TaxID=315749 RepID=A7GSR0_BACCN|nr:MULTISPECIES: hypothetical protein [Bacillus cereus group]ABS23168.1 conserved hypothetical protein [Bacillus cytotoxicus NVH 391-98]AWC33262.1 hypothetical protein CG482_013335 [Bacillus cytotoxicus]AWC33821.1 hypothetical protein CG482_016390 [Bacillus cytotoxicus]AWC37811.1 hypothetical protein CG481_016220 [Bacillus cytotoxicus]AWC45795.1 hypothetical protein CG479_015635 [Bacillus cytotoxicus]